MALTGKLKDPVARGEPPSQQEETYNFKTAPDKLRVSDRLPNIGKAIRIDCNILSSGDFSQESLASHRCEKLSELNSWRLGTLPFKSQVPRFKEPLSPTAPANPLNTESNIVEQQRPSPVFRSKAKRTVVFESIATNESQERLRNPSNEYHSNGRPMPEYFAVSHRKQLPMLNQKELKLIQNSLPFNSMSPRFKDSSPAMKEKKQEQMKQSL